MTSANISAQVEIESFVVAGRLYRWREGGRRRPGAPASTPREAQRSHFQGFVVPECERRGARGRIFAAQTPDGIAAGDARWVAWRVPGASTSTVAWGLYLVGGRIEGGGAENDAFALIAWGEGQTAVWADEREASRRVLRAALHAPPPWLVGGVRSSDPTFPVRIELLRRTPRAAAQMPLALSPPARPAGSSEPAPAALLIGILQSWRKAHPPANDTRAPMSRVSR